jgi:hypothetical protein
MYLYQCCPNKAAKSPVMKKKAIFQKDLERGDAHSDQ